MKKKRFSVEQIVATLKPIELGLPIAHAARPLGVSEQAIYRPGKPTDNCFIETFNRSLRDGCLNVHWFETLDEAKAKIEAWRKEYNESRPHQALSELTPSEFAVESRHLLTSGVIGGAGIYPPIGPQKASGSQPGPYELCRGTKAGGRSKRAAKCRNVT